MEESLQVWVSLACQNVLQIQENSTNLSDNLLQLARSLFDSSEINSLESVWDELSKNFSQEADDDLNSLAKLLLQYVVSPYCSQREKFISHIISLSPEIQENLMLAIQEQSVENSESDHDQDSLEQKQPIISFDCEECRRMKTDLENCHKELNNFVLREKQREEQYKSENSLQMHKIMDLESNLTEKNATIRELTAELSTSQKKLADFCSERKEKDQLLFKISELQDQVDSLSQMSKRAEIAESHLDKMKEKLDRLNSVNELLRAETLAHNETHATLLQLEQEVANLRTTKQHLEEYRARCVENEITIGDLKMRLQSSEEFSYALKVQLQSLVDGNEVSNSRAKMLTAELLSASEALRNQDRGNGVGQGISEFNPEIKKELQFLRVENEELKQQINQSSLEALDRLRQQLSDQQCMNTSLQQKWTISKDRIQFLEDSLDENQQKLQSSGEECQRLESDLEMTTQQLGEVNQMLHDCRSEVQLLKEISADDQEKLRHLEQKLRFVEKKCEAQDNDMEVERNKRRRVERERKLYENEATKYRNQCEIFSSGSMNQEGVASKEMQNVIKEMKLMQEQLDNSREEVKRLQDQLYFMQSSSGGCLSRCPPGSVLSVSDLGESDHEKGISQYNCPTNSLLLSGPARQIQRVRVAPTMLSGTAPLNNPTTTDLSAYIEQTELLERKIEQMNRERRELIAKNLEENKERVELNQRLLQSEGELAILKSKHVKLELEKARLERKIAKSDPENIPPPQPTRVGL